VHRVVLALGANLGDPLGQLRAAVDLIAARLSDARISAPYRSPALPTGELQPNYLNAVVVGWSARTAREWLAIAKALELAAGRRPSRSWGPRPLDVDLILCGAAAIGEPDLVVPHAEALKRAFVIGPLAEVAPELVWPGTNQTVAELAAGLDDPGMERLSW
jgi:2-amino-4-hydroxy-6-hydroxymethyldihydropteridine diphosphokinase